MLKMHQYQDGSFLPSGNEKLKRFMSGANLLSPTLDGRINFCGIIVLDNTLYSFLPKGQINGTSPLENARTLLSCIRRYAQGRGSTFSMDSGQSEIEGTSPLAALDLLQDYLASGLYRNTEPEISRKNTGKISWSHTIKKFIPVLRDDGTPVYPSLLVRKLNYFSSNAVTDIHAAIIARLDKLFGWFFTGNEDLAAPELYKTELLYEPRAAISILKKELQRVFADRDIRLLKNLISVLETTQVSQTDSSMYSGISSFEHVWEEICSFLYKNQAAPFARQIPLPAYTYDSGETRLLVQNKQRMDIIIQENLNIAVLDAKYYDVTKNTPGWGDIVKQLFYATSIRTIFPEKNVSNFFILPKTLLEDCPKEIFISTPEGTPLDKDFSRIRIIYLDVIKSMSDYNNQSGSKEYRNDILAK